GIDINPHYLEEVRRRFNDRICDLELCLGDIQTDTFAFAPVELVFAGLVFEYVDPDATLVRIRSMLGASGVLVSVLQLPSIQIPEVSPSPFTSVRALSSLMKLVPPDTLQSLAERRGYRQTDSRVAKAAGGKGF